MEYDEIVFINLMKGNGSMGSCSNLNASKSNKFYFYFSFSFSGYGYFWCENSREL